MSDRPSLLVSAAARVEKAEAMVARQRAIIQEMDQDGHVDAAVKARELLGILEQSLQLARRHLEALRTARKPTADRWPD